MYSGKEPQGQGEIPEGHCIKEGKLFQPNKTPSLRGLLFYLFSHGDWITRTKHAHH